MTRTKIKFPPSETVYAEGFTNAAWSQRVGLYIPTKDKENMFEWTGHGEHATPMDPSYFLFRTPESEDLAAQITGEFQHLDHGNWKDSRVNDQLPIKIGNYTQFTFITEDGGGEDGNDTCMFFRYWRRPLSPSPADPLTLHENKTMYIRAFTNSVNYRQRIRITVPDTGLVLTFDGDGEGMQPMVCDRDATFKMQKTQPKIEFFHLNKNGDEIPSVLSATNDTSMDALHQYTWLVRDTKEQEHQNMVLCIYHWDPRKPKGAS